MSNKYSETEFSSGEDEEVEDATVIRNLSNRFEDEEPTSQDSESDLAAMRYGVGREGSGGPRDGLPPPVPNQRIRNRSEDSNAYDIKLSLRPDESFDTNQASTVDTSYQYGSKRSSRYDYSDDCSPRTRDDSQIYDTEESFSMRHKKRTDENQIKEVYMELQQINDKLKGEFAILHERDSLLREKERLLNDRDKEHSRDKAQFERLVEEEVKRRLHLKSQTQKTEVEKLEMSLKEKTREHKRVKENFDTLKIANDTLRKELEALQVQHEKLEKQSATLQARFSNLQKIHEHNQRKNEFLPEDLLKKKAQSKDKKDEKSSKHSQKPCQGMYDMLAVLLEWLSEVHLRHSITDQPTKPLDRFTRPEFVQEKCYKILPSLVDILKELPPHNQRLVLPCLQFTYFSLVHTDHVQGHQKASLVSTLRRLGEELYRPRAIKFSDEPHPAPDPDPDPTVPSRADKVREGLFFRSHNLHVRFLSSLVILKTLTQVDHVAHVFEVIKGDLKSDPGKELFLYYQATPVLLAFMRPANKTVCNSVVDIFLQMSMESSHLSSFLETCSTELWFRTCAMVLRMPSADEKLVEKLSIILQKLSKIRGNKRYFEAFGIVTTAQEMLRSLGSENAFLTLNLKSILFNLNVKSAVLGNMGNISAATNTNETVS